MGRFGERARSGRALLSACLPQHPFFAALDADVAFIPRAADARDPATAFARVVTAADSSRVEVVGVVPYDNMFGGAKYAYSDDGDAVVPRLDLDNSAPPATPPRRTRPF